MTQTSKVESVQQIIGTMHGQRGIMFAFQTDSGQCKVVLDFYGNGAQLNGKRYADAEATALSAVVQSGRIVTSYTHTLIY
jgi:hypothetical protein